MSGLSSFINRYNIVKQIPIFSKLNWFELQKVARKSMLAEYKKGDVITSEGDPPDFFYCVASGRLQAYTIGDGEKKDNIDFIHRGMHFGIISALTGENHSLTFEALNDSVILQIAKDDFNSILKSIPQLGIEFSQSLSKRVRRKVKGNKSIFESTIISIYSPVKGTGSSTYAINLALNLQKETKKRVLFVSIHSPQTDQEDPAHPSQHTASPKWKIPAINLSEIVDDHEKILENVVKDDLCVDLLNVVIDSEDEPAKKQISPFVSALVGDYHYVVVDMPNEMDNNVIETLTQSDVVHLLTSDRKKDLSLIRSVIDRLELSLRENFREEKIKVIIRAVHAKVYLSFEEINRFIDYHVYKLLPIIPRDELKEDAKSQHLTFLECDSNSEYAKSIKRIAREIGGVLVGVVLGGGAALGVAHIGVIRVLEKENIPVDVVVGSSMGALVGSMWCIGKNARQLEVIAREFESKKNMLKLFDPVIPISGLVGGNAIKRWLRKHLGNKTFYSTTIPLKIVSYDITRREEKVLDGGSLVDAVRESIAIPGVINPVQHDEQVIIDGGVLNPLPTNVLTSRGIKKIIAVNVLQSPEDVSEGFDMEQHAIKEKRARPFLKAPIGFFTFRLGRLFSKMFTPNISDIIVRTLQATEYVIAEQSAQQADVVIHPDLVGINWFELDKVDELIKAGETATRELLPEIKKLVEEES